MNQYEAQNDSIAKDILGKTRIFLVFPDFKDCGEIVSELITIYEQRSDDDKLHYFIAVRKLKEFSKEAYENMLNLMETDKQTLDNINPELYFKLSKYNCDGYIIVNGNETDPIGYDSFYEKYYNHL